MGHKWAMNVFNLGLMDLGNRLASRIIPLPGSVLVSKRDLPDNLLRWVIQLGGSQLPYTQHAVFPPAWAPHFPYSIPVEPDESL